MWCKITQQVLLSSRVRWWEAVSNLCPPLCLFHARLEERWWCRATQQQHRCQAQRSFPQQRLPAHRDDHDPERGSGEYILPVTGTRRLHAALSFDHADKTACTFVRSRPYVIAQEWGRGVSVCVHYQFVSACSRACVYCIFVGTCTDGFVTNGHPSDIDLCTGECEKKSMCSCVCK